MSDNPQGTDEVDSNKHGAARNQAEAGDIDQAQRTDPDALATVLADDGPSVSGDGGIATDEEVAQISRQIVPGADAPSRSGITGSGSGADGMDQ